MKRFFLMTLVALCAFFASRQTGAADTLESSKRITVTGSIIQETGTNGETSIKRITIGNILNVLGISSTASQLRFNYDATTSSYVIVPKSVPKNGTASPVATVYTFGNSDGVQWHPTNHSEIGAETDTGLNGDLTGTGLLQRVYPHVIETNRISFIFFGMVSGHQTIMKGTLVDVFTGK